MKLLRDAIISISKGTSTTRTKEMGVLNPSFMSVNLQQEVKEKFKFYKRDYKILPPFDTTKIPVPALAPATDIVVTA